MCLHRAPRVLRGLSTVVSWPNPNKALSITRANAKRRYLSLYENMTSLNDSSSSSSHRIGSSNSNSSSSSSSRNRNEVGGMRQCKFVFREAIFVAAISLARQGFLVSCATDH